MKEKIIQIIGAGLTPQQAELKANEIILNFNAHIIATLKENEMANTVDYIQKLWITI